MKSGGNMGLPVWSRYGTYGNTWYQAQVAVSNQKTSYQVMFTWCAVHSATEWYI